MYANKFILNFIKDTKNESKEYNEKEQNIGTFMVCACVYASDESITISTILYIKCDFFLKNREKKRHSK